jgi:hypothetical protein
MKSYCASRTITHNLCALTFVFTSSLTHASPMDTISSWFNAYPHEEVIYKEYALQPKKACTITIDQTLNGSVSVVGWDQPNISLTATKKGKKEPEMHTLALSVKNDANNLTITTGYTKGKKKPRSACAIDLSLFVPTKATVTIDSIDDVTVNDINTVVDIITEQGPINATNIGGALSTHIDKSGVIRLENIRGSIEATTMAGDIIVKDSHQNVKARTEYGTVKVTCAETPSTSTIDLKTVANGMIELIIPEDTQATITGHTQRGKIVSTFPVTIQPYTTILTPKTYKQMPRELRGRIGQAGNTDITLSSAHGIRIRPYDPKKEVVA